MSTSQAKLELFRETLRSAHELLEGTVAGIDPGAAHWAPPGTANPIGATYAHVVLSEDATLHGMLQGQQPLFAGDWAGRTGVAQLPPFPDPAAPGFPDWSNWGRTVHVELDDLRAYAVAVYAATDRYLSTCGDELLERPVDLGPLGLGTVTVGFVLINGVLGNALIHCGEIACLKGLQGLKGYPF